MYCPGPDQSFDVVRVGRAVDYSYDIVYRLTGEDATDPVLGNSSTSYTYVAVGNRLAKTSDGNTVSYSYDASDRLLSEGPIIQYFYEVYNTLGYGFTEKVYENALAIKWVFGNRRDRKGMWGYFFGGTKKIPPHLPLTTVNPREPIKLIQHDFNVQKQKPITVYFEEQIVGEYLVDLLINDLIIVELKAARVLLTEHEAKLLNYLKASQYEVGLLLNFGPKPQIKRKAFDNQRKGLLTWVKPSQNK